MNYCEEDGQNAHLGGAIDGAIGGVKNNRTTAEQWCSI